MRITKNLILTQFIKILSANAPKRDDNSKPHQIKRHGKIISPYPGWLKNAGFTLKGGGDKYKVVIGEMVVYALAANKRSRRKNYIEKSGEQFKQKLKDWGGKVK